MMIGREGTTMNSYITGTMIKHLREAKKLTQEKLANQMNLSAKTISKWETGRGYPDISLIEPLAANLGVSIIELFSGEYVSNTNRSFNMLRTKFYVCPVCGNVIQSAGEAVISCCGIVLPSLETEPADEEHTLRVERVEDDYYVTISHEMSKTHYISFIAAIHDNGCEITKLYPEGNAEARFRVSRTRYLCFYCNQHGLFIVKNTNIAGDKNILT